MLSLNYDKEFYQEKKILVLRNKKRVILEVSYIWLRISYNIQIDVSTFKYK